MTGAHREDCDAQQVITFSGWIIPRYLNKNRKKYHLILPTQSQEYRFIYIGTGRNATVAEDLTCSMPITHFIFRVNIGNPWKLKRNFLRRLTKSNQRLSGACNRSPGWKLLSITTQLHCGGHLGGRARLPDTILEKDHPMTIPSKFGSNWATGSRQDGFYVNFP
jgi:hypothetical protein